MDDTAEANRCRYSGRSETTQGEIREQALNNDYVARVLSLTRSNVIGPNGIILQAKAQSIRGNLDTKANDAIEASWNRWGRQGSPTLPGNTVSPVCLA